MKNKKYKKNKGKSCGTNPVSERKRILNNNVMKESLKKIFKTDDTLNECDVPFIRSFYSHLLKEADEDALATTPNQDVAPETGGEKMTPDKFDDQTTKRNFDDALEPQTQKDQFDVEGVDPNISTESIKKINEWSEKLDKFAEFLNDPSTESLHVILAGEDKPGSLLRGVTRKASDSITRIAGEIEKLKEVLNSFIIMAPKKLRDTEQLKST